MVKKIINLYNKNQNKKRYTYWVSSSSNYVEILSYYKTMWDTYPKTKNATGWMKPVDYFTLKGMPMPRILTRSRTPILNDQLVAINVAEPNTILGQYIMGLNTGKAEFLQFRTVDNKVSAGIKSALYSLLIFKMFVLVQYADIGLQHNR